MFVHALVLGAGAVLRVGDGAPFATIASAVAAAKEGDVVEVRPKAGGYGREAVRVRVPNLSIRAIGAVRVDGSGFDYSGVGAVPRAIFQFDPGATGAVLEGFDLTGAHNGSHNGAGVRINGASHVTIRRCDIHANDMGVMSNGAKGDPHAGEDQLFVGCTIHENGSKADPGYNHNLYLGGTSATLRLCDVYGALTGHNVKSRAHFTMLENCHIHGGDNRQMDFVEAWDTERPDSNAVVVGCTIEADPRATGNRNMIHFGQEKGVRDGTLYLINDTITTPFLGPVVLLDGLHTRARMIDCLMPDADRARPRLFAFGAGATPPAVSGLNNVLSNTVNLGGAELSGTVDPGAPWNPTPAWLATYRDGDGVSHRGKPPLRWNAGAWIPAVGSFPGSG